MPDIFSEASAAFVKGRLDKALRMYLIAENYGTAGGKMFPTASVGDRFYMGMFSGLRGGVVGGLSSIAMGGSFYGGFRTGFMSAGLSYVAGEIAGAIEGSVGGDTKGEKARLPVSLADPKGKRYLVAYGGEGEPAKIGTDKIITQTPIEEQAKALANMLMKLGAKEVDLMLIEADFINRWNTVPAGRYDSVFYIGHTADNGLYLYGVDKSYIPIDAVPLMKSGPIAAGGSFYWLGCNTLKLVSVSSMLERGTVYGSGSRVEFPFTQSGNALLPRSNLWVWQPVP